MTKYKTMNKETQEKLLKVVKQNYEEIADDFNQTRRKALWPELVKLASEVKDGDSILDVGCGNGRLLEAFGEKKINYIGVDQSERLINLAIGDIKSPNYKLQVTNYKYYVGDILELNKATEEKFDWIFCIAVLHHLPGQELRLQALEQLKNRLKPGGKIVLTVWNLWSQWKYVKLIVKFALLKVIGKNQMDFGDIVFDWGVGKSQRYYHAFTERSLIDICRLGDLKIKKIYKDVFNYYLEIGQP